MGSYMPISIKSMIACGCLGAVILGMAACSPRRIPPMSVTDLMEDRVTLDGVLMKCNGPPRQPKRAGRRGEAHRGIRAQSREAAIGSRNAAAGTGSEDQGGCV